mmetsp:Transcript_45290/g.101954  ORF Transcript_45290/g.101954 Transcript_45290/m.101954 type:complete len:257 (-) Transcript_45290:517-1287(-)
MPPRNSLAFAEADHHAKCNAVHSHGTSTARPTASRSAYRAHWLGSRGSLSGVEEDCDSIQHLGAQVALNDKAAVVLAGHVEQFEAREVPLAVLRNTRCRQEMVVVGQADEPLRSGILPEYLGSVCAVPSKDGILRNYVPADKLSETPAEQPTDGHGQELREQHRPLCEGLALLRGAEGETADNLHTVQKADRVEKHRTPWATGRSRIVEESSQVCRERVAHDIVLEVAAAKLLAQKPAQRVCIAGHICHTPQGIQR